MSWTAERARVASLTRSRSSDDPDLVDARRNLRVERLADYIAATVAAAPALTDAQRDRLAALLRPAGLAAPTRPCGHPGDPATRCGACVAEELNRQVPNDAA